MLISIITAMDKNRVIGKENRLPWKIPAELEYVKKTTMGHPIIMGRKNFESIGRPLPGRRNIILTRNRNFHIDGCEIVHSLNDVIQRCQNEQEIFIFGGEEIYRLFFPYVNRLYITEIEHEFDGDTFFPEFNKGDWHQISKDKGIKDEKNPYDYNYLVYERIQRNRFLN